MIYTLSRRDKLNNIDTIISFDSVTSFDESWSANVTTQTVESGFNITDNINIDPTTYDINAVISSYTLFDVDREIVWNGEEFESKDTYNEFAHIEARERIKDIFKDCSLVSILESSANSNEKNIEFKYNDLTSGYNKEIENCVITSLSISHPEASSGAFLVNLKLQEIHIAEVMVLLLDKDEMSPALQKYEKQVATTSNTSSTSKGGKGGDDGVSPYEAPPEEPYQKESVDLGRGTKADFEKHRAKVLGAEADQLKALEQAAAIAKKTKKKLRVEKRGNGWYIVEID